MSLLLPFPLRSTAEWGEYREAKPLPLRYGETGGTLLQMSADRRAWAWAGHAVASVDEVLFAGVPVSNWAWKNGQDPAGKPVAIVEFDYPVDEGIDPIARGRGMLGAESGDLIDNPADVVLDLLTRSGFTATAAKLSKFRHECSAIQIGGSVDTADSTLSLVRSLCSSIDAIFAPDARGLCSLRSVSPSSPPLADVTKVKGIAAQCQLGAIVNEITIRHGWESGIPRAGVRLVARESIKLYGRRSLDIDAFWLPKTARIAASVGERILSRTARPAWEISAGDFAKFLRVGDVVSVDVESLPALNAQVLTASRSFALNRSSVAFELPVGAAPVITIEQLSEQSAAQAYAGVTIETQGQQRVLTILDSNGQPDAGATVQVNGGAIIRADGAGRVYIPADLLPAGVHVLVVTYSSGQTMAVTVTI